jgi:glutathione S-transferase
MAAAGRPTESPYQRWLRDAPKRRTEREAVYRSLAGMMRADSLAAFRDAMERTEREVGEGLRRDDSRFMAGAAEGQRHIDRHLADLERELAAMSPSQRASQAWIGGNSPSLLTAAGAPQARRLVAPNPDFYDRARPATDVQALLVEFVTYSETQYVFALTGAVFRSLDWKALASFVRP